MYLLYETELALFMQVLDMKSYLSNYDRERIELISFVLLNALLQDISSELINE